MHEIANSTDRVPPQPTESPLPPPAEPKKAGKSMLFASVFAGAVLLLGAGGAVGLVLTRSGGGGAADPGKEVQQAASNQPSDPLASLRAEINALEREVRELESGARSLNADRDTAEREARDARSELDNLVSSGKSGRQSSVTPRGGRGRQFARMMASVGLSPRRAAVFALTGQVGFGGRQPSVDPTAGRPPAQRGAAGYGGASFSQGTPRYQAPPAYHGSAPAPTEAERLEARHRELLDKRQRLLDNRAAIERGITALQETAASLRAKVEQLRGFLQADLVFVQSGALAVGLKSRQPSGFVVTAMAEGVDAAYANQVAHRANLLRVQEDGRLIRRLAAEATVGRPVPGTLLRSLLPYWKPRVYVPDGVETLVTFHDLDSGTHRVGFYRDHDSTVLRVATRKDPNESVPRSRIGPGTALRGGSERLLARAPEADFLDFVVLEVGRAISTTDEATYHRLAVQTKLDITPTRIERLAGYRPTRYLNACARMLLENESLRDDLQSGRFEKDRKFEGLRNHIEDLLIEKLTELGVPVLERENVVEVQVEQAIRGDLDPSSNRRRVDTLRSRYTGDGWTADRASETRRGPSLTAADEIMDVARTLNQPIPIDDPGSLSFATHVLVLEIGDAGRDTGSLRFAGRLIDSKTGRVVWAGGADRPVYNRAVATDHMLGSGDLVAINRPKSRRRIAGNPMPMRFDMNGGGPLASRVAYYEGMRGGRMLLRDLFSYRAYAIDPLRMDKATSGKIRTVDEVPEDNRMRHVMWAIAQAVRPPAGRVVEVGERPGGEGFVSVSCRLANRRFTTADSLTANRLERDYSGGVTPYLKRMPVDLTLRDLQPDRFTATFDTTARDAIWSDEVSLQLGDIVCARGNRQPLIAVVPPRLEKPTNQDWEKLGLDAPLRLEDFLGWSADGAGLLARRLTDTLAEMRTPVVEVNNVSEAAGLGATHIVRGRIRPTVGRAFFVQLKVYETDRAEPLETLRVKLGRDQLNKWRP